MEGKKNMDSIEKPIIKDDEIDLIEIVKTIWAGRGLILKVTAVFFVVGLVIAFGSKVEYEASCKLMPESQEGTKPNLGGLGGLAGLAGINLNLGSTSGSLTPELYPQIAQSIPFILKIIKEPIHFEKQDTTISSYNFFTEIEKPAITSYIIKYTIGLPSEIKSWIFSQKEVVQIKKAEKQDIIRFSKKEHNLISAFKRKIIVEVDSKTGIIKIGSVMPDPIAAAELSKLCVDLLTEYVISYKTEKAKKNLDFIEQRCSESKKEFEKSQKKLAIFSDRNKNVVTSIAQTELQRLQNEYNVNFEVYKSLATQLEQAKIKVKEKTPIFTVLDPIEVPIYKSKPQRKLILAIYLSLGVIIGISMVGIKNLIIMTRND